MSEETEKKSGIRPIQVAAAALAAVTAALLGSTLGVAGTVLGAGLASVITTVGGELYLRSLDRTKAAALKARTLTTRPQVAPASSTVESSGVAAEAEDPAEAGAAAEADAPSAAGATAELPVASADGETPEGEQQVSRLRKLRWPLVIGTSVVGFVLAILVITGFEFATGSSISGDGRSTIGHIVSGGGGKQEAPTEQAPASETREAPASKPSQAPATESSAPTTTAPAEPSDPPTSSAPKPSVTTTEKPAPSTQPSVPQGQSGDGG